MQDTIKLCCLFLILNRLQCVKKLLRNITKRPDQSRRHTHSLPKVPGLAELHGKGSSERLFIAAISNNLPGHYTDFYLKFIIFLCKIGQHLCGSNGIIIAQGNRRWSLKLVFNQRPPSVSSDARASSVFLTTRYSIFDSVSLRRNSLILSTLSPL